MLKLLCYLLESLNKRVTEDRWYLDKPTARALQEGICGLLGRQVGSVGILWIEAYQM